MFFKYDYDEGFRLLQVKQTTRGQLSTAKTMIYSLQLLPCLYDSSPTKSKFNGFQFLCKSNATPQPYHAFYNGFRYDERESVDRLPEPSSEKMEERTFDQE